MDRDYNLTPIFCAAAALLSNQRCDRIGNISGTIERSCEEQKSGQDLATHVTNPGAGNPLKIPIANEFNHTNLKEVRILWNISSQRGEVQALNLAPHSTGYLTLPARTWRNGEVVHFKFIGE